MVDGDSKIVLVPVSSRETTVVRPKPEVKPDPTPKPDPKHDFVGPPAPPKVDTHTKDTKHHTVVPKPADTKTNTTVKVDPKPHPAPVPHSNLVAPLLVGVTILGWWIMTMFSKKPKKVEKPAFVPEIRNHEDDHALANQTPVVPMPSVVMPPSNRKSDELIILVGSKKAPGDEASTDRFSKPFRFRSFAETAESYAGRAADPVVPKEVVLEPGRRPTVADSLLSRTNLTR